MAASAKWHMALYCLTWLHQTLSISRSLLNALQVPSTTMPPDPTASVLVDVIKKMGGGQNGSCHVLLCYDHKTVTQDDLTNLQTALDTPITLLDVTQLNFGLVTIKNSKKTLPVVELLTNHPEAQCRILLSWSAPQFQRSLLILARFQAGVVRNQDILLLSTNDKNLAKFIPEMRRKVIVRKEWISKKIIHLGTSQTRFVVERVCDDCGDFRMERIGEWRELNGFKWDGKKQNLGLSGSVLRVSYTTSVPNIFTGQNGNLDGLEYRMLDYASRALNFSYVLKTPADGQLGAYINGTWTGKIGDIAYNKADLVIGGVVYQSDRAGIASYSVMFHQELWGIVCPPSQRMPLWPYIMFPFRSETASSVFTFLVLVHIIAFLVVTFVSNLKKDKRARTIHPIARSIQNVFRVSTSIYLKFMACLYFWNLFFCIMQPQYEEPIDSAQALLSSSKKWGLVHGTTVESVLSKSFDRSQRKLVQNAQILSSISEGLNKIESSDMCIVGVPKRFAKSTIKSRYTTLCGEAAIQVSEEDLNMVLGGWLMADKSPLKQKLDPIIRRLQGFGFIDKWTSDLYDGLSKKREEQLPCIRRPVGPLTLADLRLAFFLMLAGCGASILILILEHFADYVLSKYDITLLPWYVDSFDPENHQYGRRNQTQQTWSEFIMSQITGGIGTRNPDIILNEALYRFHMSILLRNVQSVSEDVTINPESRARSLSRMSVSLSTPDHADIQPQQNSESSLTTTLPNSVSDSDTPQDTHPVLRRSNSSPNIGSLDVSAPSITVVKPYETRLSRAARLLPWNHMREMDPQEVSMAQRFPNNAPDSPHPRLPPMKEPIFSGFRRRLPGSRVPVQLETLREIASTSDFEDLPARSSTMGRRESAAMRMVRRIIFPRRDSFKLNDDSSSDDDLQNLGIDSARPNRLRIRRIKKRLIDKFAYYEEE